MTSLPHTPAESNEHVGPSVVWFRDDLRVGDHPALHAALARHRPIVAVYVFDDESPGVRTLGGAARWWLHQSLRSLGATLEALGGGLILRRGPAAPIITEIARETDAAAVFWNRRYGSAERMIDTAIKAELRADGVDAHSFAGSLLFEPWTIQTGQGGSYSVFTPFWRACQAGPPPRAPYPSPDTVSGWSGSLATDSLDDWGLEPSAPDWADGLRAAWQPGETSAQQMLGRFLAESLPRYGAERDEPAQNATSRLSPYLRWGEISPHQVWAATQEAQRSLSGPALASATRFLTEVGWREFAYHVLFHAPELATKNLRPAFDAFPWPELDHEAVTAWQQGRTGFALVDAGMRELWRTGSMHNRVRMVTASFLIKNMLVDWRVGERWFWDTLVDADAASNPFGWQWVAGSGADAAPYFRIFNPELQAAKFDPHQQYIRANVPEYGTDAYPAPLVDLGETRRAALAAYDKVKAQSAS
ncbi:MULTISPECIES: deoxyribodipyrimidine photo-lyase [Cryobacterium]|uniref:Deoxyribodipyrimidine photo-lyase n=1 Tax=Cryobacterium levicorallinum TaxID=995038 RepID=A0A1I2YMF9_9MICO|nr:MULTISPECIES: deoxyribodipyrimidine photo-lyase [Cryobacterium]TFB86056.1 deoxyribodipyrimidine photo-lyase [Cryobacterium levicorallinum]TFD60351.1 deoxyribodipyrimidine photo-lyase [Cryobacterium sp. Hh38]GEP27581.1 deoxyribodipyrimidine photo-lyase [Cryobacterium levicorallinum]SFH26825.1 deoxyribodipyrimidine photo-lyase [Cryobacterium levicorallinum]